MSQAYYYSPSTVVYLWGYIDVIRYKWQILFLGVGELIFALPIFIFLILGLIPFTALPPLYSGIWYVGILPIWIVNVIMSDSRSTSLFLFAFFANAFVFLCVSVVFGFLLYNVIACWTGALPTTCRDNQLWALLTLWFTLLLWIICFFIFFAYLAIMGRIRQTNSVNQLKLNKVYT